MNKPDIPDDFLEFIQKITNKRAKIVIAHILKHGYITTEELEKNYGYKHPPRAARDVREAGIPLQTFKVKSTDGEKLIAAYKFGDFKNLMRDRIKGRMNWPKKFKTALLNRYGAKCVISGAELSNRELQIDHRIPYEILGDNQISQKLNVEDFMLLSRSSNRAKSKSCEQCSNWIDDKNPTICRSCYWAFPESYTHIAMKAIRQTTITWQNKEVSDYDRLKKIAEKNGMSLGEFIKLIIKKKKS